MTKYELGLIKAEDVYPKRGPDGKIHLGNFPTENTTIVSPNDDNTSFTTSVDSRASESYTDFKLEPLPEELAESDDMEEAVYLTQDMVDAIAMESSDANPGLLRRFRELERGVSEEFIRQYGHLLSEPQLEFIRGQATGVYENETMNQLWELDDEITIGNDVELESSWIGRYWYMGYTDIKDAKRIEARLNSREEHDGEEDIEANIWGFASRGLSGLVSLNLSQEENEWFDPRESQVQVNREKYLAEVANGISPQEAEENYMEALKRERLGTWYASIITHEKGHSIQNKGLPLPLLEAQCYWLQKQIVEGYQGFPYETDYPLDGFVNAFQELYDEFGDDLHRLIWGTINDDNKEGELLERVKSRMTPEFIDSMLSEGFYWAVIERTPISELSDRDWLFRMLGGTDVGSDLSKLPFDDVDGETMDKGSRSDVEQVNVSKHYVVQRRTTARKL